MSSQSQVAAVTHRNLKTHLRAVIFLKIQQRLQRPSLSKKQPQVCPQRRGLRFRFWAARKVKASIIEEIRSSLRCPRTQISSSRLRLLNNSRRRWLTLLSSISSRAQPSNLKKNLNKSYRLTSRRIIRKGIAKVKWRKWIRSSTSSKSKFNP